MRAESSGVGGDEGAGKDAYKGRGMHQMYGVTKLV